MQGLAIKEVHTLLMLIRQPHSRYILVVTDCRNTPSNTLCQMHRN